MFVSVVTGTRPQIVKTAPVIAALSDAGIDFEFVHTGQHYDYELAGAFVDGLSLPKPTQLGVGEGKPYSQLAGIVESLGSHYEKRRPDYVIVPGDTTSALGAALAGFKMDIPVCHLESGLRIYDFGLQEEMNRRMIDHGASALFAPTTSAVKNLGREGVLGRVFQIGDTMYDILKTRLPELSKSEFRESVKSEVGVPEDTEYAVLTLHRRENVDERQVLIEIVEALNETDFQMVFPMHPRTGARLREFNLELDSDRIAIVPPLPYDKFVSLVSDSKLVISDSGGIQKECYLLNVPLVTLRKRTEWIETVQRGANVLSTLKRDDIMDKCQAMYGKELSNDPSVYGDGNAAKRIPDILESESITVPSDPDAKHYTEMLDSL
ncbi:MAG: non-hydrolyzing UDP-N-acetylglucosamine 2-epimerase [Candidatus Thorarchaeota archaeon]